MLWITERQLGRRNISDDQRTMVALQALEIKARISRSERARKAGEVGGQIGGRGRPKEIGSGANSASKPIEGKETHPKERTRSSTAKDHKIPEKKLRNAAEIKKAGGELAGMVIRGRASSPAPSPLFGRDGYSASTAGPNPSDKSLQQDVSFKPDSYPAKDYLDLIGHIVAEHSN